MKSPSRNCDERDRFHRLKELRRWYWQVLSAENQGRQELLIFHHPETQDTTFQYGWSCWGSTRLADGTTFHVGGPGPHDLPRELARAMYRHLSRHIRHENAR